MTKQQRNVSEGPADFRAEAGAQGHWERIKQRLEVRVAALIFVATLLATFVIIHTRAEEVRQFYLDVNREVNYCDMTELNEYGDYVLQDYLAGQKAPGVAEAVIIGASYTANGYDPDPIGRIHRCLERRLEPATGQDWQITNLASNGYCPWSFFYVTRLLRSRRPPRLLIISLDAVYIHERNKHLLLSVGIDPKLLSCRELAGVLPVNRHLQYFGEANLLVWLRQHVAFFKAFTYLKTSYPKRDTIKRWLQWTSARWRGLKPELAVPGNRHPDGRHKSWREIPEARARMEKLIAKGDELSGITTARARNLDLLGRELAACQQEGMRVLVVTMPRNPVIPLQAAETQRYVREWAERHGLEFHDFWRSGLIPTEYYIDTGHFFGEGCEIMAQAVADILTEGEW